MELDLNDLSKSEIDEIGRLVKLSNNNPMKLEDMWRIIDFVWDEMGCNNTQVDIEKIAIFYKHPVWLLNGFFAETDPESIAHRQAIVTWVNQNCVSRVIDFGGGIGSIARMIASQSNGSIRIDIYEPYPTQYSIKKSKPFRAIRFIDSIHDTYDCLISTDVLEHAIDPILTLSQMVRAVETGGFLLIANHFYPSIKCHLPCTFHLRYTFDTFAEEFGLKKIDKIRNGYISIYQKNFTVEPDWRKLRRMEVLSQRTYHLNRFRYSFLPDLPNKVTRRLLLMKKRLLKQKTP